MFSSSVIRWIGLSFLLLVLALALGNSVILAGAVFLLLNVLLGAALLTPTGVTVARQSSQSVCWAGDVVEIRRDLQVGGAPGVVVVHDRLPEEVQLVGGNNFRVIWKWIGSRRYDLSYRLMCPKRGTLTLTVTEWQSQDPLGLRRPVYGNGDCDLEISVVPRLQGVMRLDNARSIKRRPPSTVELFRVAVSTTDFVDMRPYTPGDTIRSINWKASARSLASRNELLVNRYEPEGRRTVWIFLDGADYMDVGTSLVSPIEHAVEAVGTLAWFYLTRGYTLGAYIYNSPGGLLVPDVGRKQFHQLTQMLTTMRTGALEENLLGAVERCKSFLFRLQPETYVISRLDVHYPRSGDSGESLENFAAGVTRLAALRTRSNRAGTVNVVNVGPQEYLLPESALEGQTLSLMQWESRPLSRLIQRAGGTVMEWSPMKEEFATVLLRQLNSVR